MSDITNAIKQICDEKSLSYESVIETIESALAAAYRKDFGEKNQNIKVEFDPESGKSKVYDVKTVVEDMPEEPSVAEAMEGERGEEGTSTSSVQAKKAKAGEGGEQVGEKTEISEQSETSTEIPEEEKRRFNPKTEIQIKDAELIKKTIKIGEEIRTKLEVPASYGRMAAQTAKQVIIQKLREAERDMIFNDFKNKEKEVIAGVIQRREGRTVLVDLDKTVGYLPAEEQIMGERYRSGDRIKVYVREVNLTSKGPEIILSRTSDEILKKVFYLEIQEISNGLVEIKAVAREAGSRSKVAVAANAENVDPIGSCVGQRGARIQTIIGELGGEKIDIIEYNEEPARFIANALAPAKVINVELNNNEKKATAKVAEDQLSLAIGRDGQNVRLAARLTGWKLDIVGDKKKDEVKKENTEVEEQKGAGEIENNEVTAGEENKEVEEEKKKNKRKSKGTKKQEEKADKASVEIKEEERGGKINETAAPEKEKKEEKEKSGEASAEIKEEEKKDEEESGK